MGQILNEYDIGIYKGTRNIFSVLSIVGSVSNCSLEFCTKRRKREKKAAELSVAGERKYYVVCIPSSRQLKKYKIFVLPGVYRATFLCRQSLLFMKFHWC